MGEIRGCVQSLTRTLDNKYLLTIEATGNVRELFDEMRDKDCDISIKKHREKRSLDANAYFHLLVSEIAKSLNISLEQCKVNMNIEYGTIAKDVDGKKIGFMLPQNVDVNSLYKYTKWFDEREINGVKFNCYIVFKETHTLNSKEMARLIDGTIQEAKQLGIETATPDEIARMNALWGEKIGA
jgi:hypothetical protein